MNKKVFTMDKRRLEQFKKMMRFLIVALLIVATTLMFIMFWSTFTLGAYPQEWIEVGGVVMMEYTFKPVGNALEMDYYGVTMTFTPAE